MVKFRKRFKNKIMKSIVSGSLGRYGVHGESAVFLTKGPRRKQAYIAVVCVELCCEWKKL